MIFLFLYAFGCFNFLQMKMNNFTIYKISHFHFDN